MRSILFAAAVLAALSAAPATASVTFSLNGVTLTTGSLNGSFTTDDALTSVIDYSITASAGTANGFTFNSLTYTPGNSSVVAQQLPGSFTIWTTTPNDQLRLNFSQLVASGAALLTSSYEFQIQAGSRFVTAGRAVTATSAVPEPASWATIILGVGAIGVALRRRVRASEVRFNERIRQIAAGEID